jgi:hypothetical protein
MNHYRIYPLSRDGSIATGLSVECETDDEAIEVGIAQLGDRPALEVWCGTRRVCHLLAEECASWRPGQTRETLE